MIIEYKIKTKIQKQTKGTSFISLYLLYLRMHYNNDNNNEKQKNRSAKKQKTTLLSIAITSAFFKVHIRPVISIIAFYNSHPTIIVKRNNVESTHVFE